MDAPDAATIRARSPLLTALYSADDDAILLTNVTDATALVLSLTCNTLDTIATAAEPIALRAITMKVEELSYLGDPRKIKAIMDRTSGGLRSISAGSWSESYFDPGAALKAKMLSANPLLHEALWALMGDECRAAFLATVGGVNEPASTITAIDWAGQQEPGLY